MDDRRKTLPELVSEHTRPLEDLVDCYRILLGDDVVERTLRELGDRIVRDTRRTSNGVR